MHMKRAFLFVFFMIAPIWAAATSASASSRAAPISEQEQNKAIARRVFDEIFNQGKFQVADETQTLTNKGLQRSGREDGITTKNPEKSIGKHPQISANLL